MAKIKYDVTNVESLGDFKQPKPGMYKGKIDSIEAGQSKAGNDQLKVVIKITEKGEFEGSNLFHYVPSDPDSPGYFRMEEFTRAMGLKKKGTLDTDKLKDQPVQVRVKADSFEGEYRARVGAVLAPKDADADEEDLDDEDEDLEEEEEEEEEDDDAVDLDELDRKALKAYIKENELEVRVTQKMSDEDIRAAILAAEAEAEPEEEEEEEEEESDEDGDDYDDWSVDQLKAELKERGLKVGGKQSLLIGRLRKDDEDEDDPFAE